LFIVAGLSFAAPVITVVPSIGPGFGSPSDAQYALNALTGLQAPPNSVGSGAATYTRLLGGSVLPNQIISTGDFNNWLGIAAPNALFNAEFGNALYFGLTIVNTAAKFSLSQLVYEDNFATYDPANFTNAPLYFNTADPADTYSGSTIIGIDFVDGIAGNGNDIVYSTGQANTTLVNALFYRGVNGAFGLFPGVGTNQQRLNESAAAISSQPITLTGTYCLTPTPGQGSCAQLPQGSASVSVVPEPGTYALFGAGLAALAFVRRRRS